MPTETIYYENPYQQELECKVINVEPKGALANIELDKTIFYPEGGGQPSDQGEIIGSEGRARIQYVRLIGGHIIHQGKLGGTIKVGDTVKTVIKWNTRYKNMRMHAAGHLIHDVLMGMTEGLTPTKGTHGENAYLEYSGPLDPNIKDELERKVNEEVAKDLVIMTKEATYDEIVATCKFVPQGLPMNKQLRVIKIGDFDAMPDGGVHVKSTKEIGQITIKEIISSENKWVIKYKV
jgi:alanyl-tRNA synthetase